MLQSAPDPHPPELPASASLPIFETAVIVLTNQMVGESFHPVVAGVRTVTTQKRRTVHKLLRLFAIGSSPHRLCPMDVTRVAALYRGAYATLRAFHSLSSKVRVSIDAEKSSCVLSPIIG